VLNCRQRAEYAQKTTQKTVGNFSQQAHLEIPNILTPLPMKTAPRRRPKALLLGLRAFAALTLTAWVISLRRQVASPSREGWAPFFIIFIGEGCAVYLAMAGSSLHGSLHIGEARAAALRVVIFIGAGCAVHLLVGARIQMTHTSKACWIQGLRTAQTGR